MRIITSDDLDRLKNFYKSGSYNDLKVVFSYLRIAQSYLTDHKKLTIESNDGLFEINSAKGFEMWLESSFPLILEELEKGEKSALDDSDDFPHFKKQIRAPQNLCASPQFKLIKKVSLWDTEQRIKQNHQKISEIKYESQSNRLVFNLALNGYIKIEEPGKITESDYSIIVQDSPSVKLKLGNKPEVTYLKENAKVKVFSEDDFLNSINCKSIFMNAVEIFK